MQLIITTDDIKTAPSQVRDWLLSSLQIPESVAEADSKPARKAKSKSTTEKTTSKPSLQEVMDKAVELMEAKGEDALASVLEKMGVKRVKECPEDKLAELLAEISINV